MVDGLVGQLFGSPITQDVFSERGRLQGMLDFEAALARVEGRLGAIPADAAEVIAQTCHPQRFDMAALGREARLAGNTAIPMVRRLTQLVAERDAAAAAYVHWGATSQDAQDTGLVLQVRTALDGISPILDRLCAAAGEHARRHRDTLLPGRTWMQHALPIPFGLKAAGWLDALARHRTRLEELRGRLLVLQFGGAAGTLASLGTRGLVIAEALAAELRLGLPALPWHAHRDRIAEMGTWLAILAGTLGKIARDISLLMQTDVAEAFEPAAPGKGGSSSMPQKRNPVSSAVVLAAAVRAPGLAATLLAAMVQEHERGLGGWHAEWTALPDLFDLVAGALEHTLVAVEGLEVDPARMRANLDRTRGQVMAEAVKMALAERLGGPEAHALVERACASAMRNNGHLREAIAAEPRAAAVLSRADLERLFAPDAYLGVSQELIDRAIAVQGRSRP